MTFTRRQFIQSSLGLFIPATLLSACGGSEPPPRPTPTTEPYTSIDLYDSMRWMNTAMSGDKVAANVSTWRRQQKGFAREQSYEATQALEEMGFDDISRSPVYQFGQYVAYSAESDTNPDLWCMALIPLRDRDNRFGMFEGPTALTFGLVAYLWSDLKGVGRNTQTALLPYYEDWFNDPPVMQPFDERWQFEYPTEAGSVKVKHIPHGVKGGKALGETTYKIDSGSKNKSKNIVVSYQNDTITL